MKINFKLPDDNQYHQFCPNCYSEQINRCFKNNKTFYKCDKCNGIFPRLIVIDPKIKWWIDKNTKEYWHESVGVFLFNKNNECLLFERIIYPFAFTIPAGHLDAGEKPINAIQRELLEETGIKMSKNSFQLFTTEDVIGDECRRGADNHRWHLFIAKILKDDISIKLNDEGVKPVWLFLKKALSKKLVFPVKYFIEKYGDNLKMSAII